jgi:hypothetical protein
VCRIIIQRRVINKKQVVDQEVQLNRILRLLEEEEMSLYRRCGLYESKKSRRYSRPAAGYNPFRSGLEASEMALKRHKLFEVNKNFYYCDNFDG